MPRFVTSNVDIEFPSLHFFVAKGETKELPENKEAQDLILSRAEITEVEGNNNSPKSAATRKDK